MYSLNGEFIRTFDTMIETAKFIGTNPTNVFDCCNQKQLRCKNYICVYHGDKLEDRRKSITATEVDVYDAKTKQFIKTFQTQTAVKKELNISSMGVIQRCMRTNNHLAGNYLIVPHGAQVE